MLDISSLHVREQKADSAKNFKLAHRNIKVAYYVLCVF